MAQANVKLTVDARSAVSSLNNTTLATNKLSAAAKGTSASLVGTSAAAKGLAASLATTMGPIIALGAAFSTLNSGLKVFANRQRDVATLTQGLQNLDEGVDVLNRLQKAASDFGDATLFSQEEFTRGFALLTTFRKIGVDSYEKVAKSAADVAQTNGVELKNAFMQLAKALEDPERNLSTLNRSGISFNKTQTDTIKKLMKANKTAEAHAMILEVVNGAYKELATAAGAGFAGDIDALTEAFNDFAEVLGESLVPVIQPAVKGLTALLEFFSSEGGQVTAAIAGAALAYKGLSVVIAATTAQMSAMSIAAVATNGTLAASSSMALVTSASFAKATAAVTAFKFALAKTGIGLAVVGFGLLVTEILKAANAQREFNKLLETGSAVAIKTEIADLEKEQERLNKQLEGTNRLLMGILGVAGLDIFTRSARDIKLELAEVNNKIAKLKEGLPNAEARDLAKEFEKTKIALIEKNAILKETEDRLKIGTEEERKQFDLTQRRNELVEKYGEELAQEILDQEAANRKIEESIELLKAKDKAAKKLKETFKEIGQSVEEGIVSNLTDAVMGTQTLAEAAINVLDDLKRKLIEVAIQSAISGIGGQFGGFLGKVFGGGKERGGRVSAGGAYVVGERGPELLQMGSKGGNIIPNNKIGGGTTNNVVVNVNVEGGVDAQGEEEESRQLGSLIAVAVQNEIIKQQRPNGLLSR